MGMLNSVRAGIVLLGGLVGAAAQPAGAEMIPLVKNTKIDDSVQPAVLVNNGPSDCSIVGLPIKNVTANPVNVLLSLPLAAIGGDGLPATDSPGLMHWRAVSSGVRFNYDAITGAPVEGETEGTIVIPPIDQTSSVFESLAYGTWSFELTGLQLEPNQSTVIALDFAPQNGCSALMFINDGTDGQALALGAQPAYYVSADWTGPLNSAGPFGGMQCAAFEAQAIVLEPFTSAWLGGNTSGPTNWGLAANWDGLTVPDGPGKKVSFGSQVTANNIVDLGSAGRTVGAITFTAVTSTTIQNNSGFSLTLDNNSQPATIDVSGSHTIAVPVLLAGDATISGPGTLNLPDGISGPHTLTVTIGTLTASSIQVDTLVISSAAAAVPEPSTFALLGISAFGLLAYAWRMRTSA